MRKINFTRQLFAAALLVAMSLTGCQKSEMEDVNPIGSSTSQALIDGGCGSSQFFELKRINNENEVIGTVEINNTNEALIIKFTSKDPMILQAQATVNGQEFTLHNKGKNAQNIQVLTIRVPETSIYQITNLGMKAGAMGDQSNKIVDMESNEVMPRGEFMTEWKWSICGTWDCGLGQGYWKNLSFNNWPIKENVKVGLNFYTPEQLHSLLNSPSDRKSVQLAKAIILASLTVAVINDSADELSIFLKEAISEANNILIDNNVDVLTGDDLIQSVVPGGLNGRLHQLAPCE